MALAGWYEVVLSSIFSHSSFIMSLVNEHPGHNKTSSATHSHQQSNIPSRALHNVVGHNKHKWCPAFAQTFAASGCLNAGLLPPSPHSSLLRREEQRTNTARLAVVWMLRPPALVMGDRQDLTEVWSRKAIGAQSGLQTLWNVASARRPFTLSVRSSRGRNMTGRLALAINHPECCLSSDTGHPSPLTTAF